MPPLTATPKPLEPLVVAPIDRDAWIEKVFGPRERKQNFVHRSVQSNGNGEEGASCYSEELAKLIAESCANLSNEGEEPLDDSDDDSSEEDAEIDDDIFDFAGAQPADKFVAPPVEVPRNYRAQDLHGGMLVGETVSCSRIGPSSANFAASGASLRSQSAEMLANTSDHSRTTSADRRECTRARSLSCN